MQEFGKNCAEDWLSVYMKLSVIDLSFFVMDFCKQEALLWVDEVGFKEIEKVPALLHPRYLRRHSMRRRDQCAALVVGHYCHDRLTLHGGRVVESLGGSVSYITNVFEALGMECRVMNLYSVYCILSMWTLYRFFGIYMCTQKIGTLNLCYLM